MSMVLITFFWCNAKKDNPGATALNKKKSRNNLVFISGKSKYIETWLRSLGVEGIYMANSIPYVGINRGKNTQEKK